LFKIVKCTDPQGTPANKRKCKNDSEILEAYKRVNVQVAVLTEYFD
jgi:hypothetical protein